MHHGARILVVDDESLSRDVLLRRLAAAGYTRATALARAQECLGLLAAQTAPDIILLDVSMPQMDGLALLRSLRQTWPKSQLPIILVTALVDSDDVIRGLEAGANDYVVKPVNMPVLIARIENCLELRDEVSRRSVSEHAQLDSELRFRLAFDSAPIGMAIFTLDGRFIKVNDAICRMSGYSREELLRSTFESTHHPEDVEPTWQRARKLLDGEVEQYELEKRIVHKDGHTVWTLACTTLGRDPATGRPLYFITQVQDITQRKRDAEALRRAHDELEQRVRERTAELQSSNERLREEIAERRLVEMSLLAHQRATRELASQLSLAEEQERHRIAAGLHDDIGQLLALMKMKIAELEHPTDAGAHADDEVDTGTNPTALDEIRPLLDEAIRRSRSLTFELGARILYEFGLETAIENLCEQLTRQASLRSRFADDDRPKPLEEGIKVALFRATRELMHNVVKHARAKTVDVKIARGDDDRVRIVVEDDGVGFDVAQLAPQPESGGGFGLFNIRERLAFVGGEMQIESIPGKGTRVTLCAPIEKDSTDAESEVKRDPSEKATTWSI